MADKSVPVAEEGGRKSSKENKNNKSVDNPKEEDDDNDDIIIIKTNLPDFLGPSRTTKPPSSSSSRPTSTVSGLNGYQDYHSANTANYHQQHQSMTMTQGHYAPPQYQQPYPAVPYQQLYPVQYQQPYPVHYVPCAYPGQQYYSQYPGQQYYSQWCAASHGQGGPQTSQHHQSSLGHDQSLATSSSRRSSRERPYDRPSNNTMESKRITTTPSVTKNSQPTSVVRPIPKTPLRPQSNGQEEEVSIIQQTMVASPQNTTQGDIPKGPTTARNKTVEVTTKAKATDENVHWKKRLAEFKVTLSTEETQVTPPGSVNQVSLNPPSVKKVKQQVKSRGKPSIEILKQHHSTTTRRGRQ